MRHKKIIIALAALLCVLLVIKAVVNHKENTTYPLQLEWSAVHKKHSYSPTPKIDFAVKDRVNNTCDNPLFFLGSSVELGMSKADVEKATKTDNAVFFDGKLVPCGIVYKYTEDDLLEAVYVRISPSVYSDAPKMIISYLGEKRVDITSEFVISEHIWFYPDYYVFLDFNPNNNKDKVYITVALYNSKNYRSIPELALYGGGSDYDFSKTSSTSPSSSSTGTYKYGNSDTYQGSSKQAEDLAAIDAYFGF